MLIIKIKCEKPKAKIICLDNEISVLMISPPPYPPKLPKKISQYGDERDNYINWA
ncbi:MAG: hypothetical protein KAI79_03350 [Bacteroidales bacterium]|nr:hypothetical protein [Bacteroidales bacterium]